MKYNALACCPEVEQVAPHGGAWIEISRIWTRTITDGVAPHGGAWIEMGANVSQYHYEIVAPHGGAWIEITFVILASSAFSSPLTEGRGLKSCDACACIRQAHVAPHGGAWIEMGKCGVLSAGQKVAPHGGAWIEIWSETDFTQDAASPLTEGRGLKYHPQRIRGLSRCVAPHGGAWIEIFIIGVPVKQAKSPLTEGRGLK